VQVLRSTCSHPQPTNKEAEVTRAETNLCVAMLKQAVECLAVGDFERAEGWCAGAWELIGDHDFVDQDDR
jgi:hypothetical protein